MALETKAYTEGLLKDFQAYYHFQFIKDYMLATYGKKDLGIDTDTITTHKYLDYNLRIRLFQFKIKSENTRTEQIAIFDKNFTEEEWKVGTDTAKIETIAVYYYSNNYKVFPIQGGYDLAQLLTTCKKIQTWEEAN